MNTTHVLPKTMYHYYKCYYKISLFLSAVLSGYYHIYIYIHITMYIKPLSVIIDSHTITHHSFADDLQLQMSAPPDGISELLHSIQSCISDVKAWATANMLKLNDNKTELMLVTSKRTKHLHNPPTTITIGNG